LDDIVGHGFLILARGVDPGAVLSEKDLAFWHSLGGTILRLADAGADATGDRLVDVEGHYGKLMDEYGCDVIVKRPDYYIFGACRTVGDLPALIADMRDQLRTGRAGRST
jgi:hypothetical protein